MNHSATPIVVGIAGKQPTVLRFAVREALRAGTGLRVVHAASVPTHDVGTYVGAREFEDTKIRGQGVLDDAQEIIEQEASQPEVSYVLSVASANEALERASSDAQLLVIGADGVPWYDRVRDSGVIRHMTRHARCAIVVVPEIARPDPTVGGLVVALDGDTSPIGPLTYAFDQARARRHDLHVLHATSPATLAADSEAIRADLAELLAGYAQTHPDVRVSKAFIVDGTEQAIVSAGEQAELVVVGRSRSRNLSFALTRPLAMQVLRWAGCPVAIVPPDYQGV